MRKIFLVAALGLNLFLSACEEEPDFYMNISLHEDEQGSDINSSSTVVDITGREVTYVHNYSWSEEAGDTEEHFQLSRAEYEEMLMFIRENWLNQSLDETQYDDETGVSIALRLSVELEGDSYVSTLVGGENSLVNKEYLSDVSDLISLVREAGELN